MTSKLSQHQRMLHKMALTPQMRLAIQLLGMSTKDLNEYIDSIAAANPFLQKLLESKSSTLPGNKPLAHAYNEKIDVKHEEDPRLALISQARMTGLEGKDLEIAEYLIYEMDDNGYIAVDAEEVANELFTGIEEVQRVIEVIQGMEPAGIGASDVRECLQLQLQRAGKQGSLEYTIVTDFIQEVARNDVDKISKAMKADIAKVKKAVENIKRLNPRPASTLLAKGSQAVIPDLFAKINNKKVRLAINREWLPRLKLYNPYEDKLEIISDPEAKKFLKENMEAAKGLIDSVTRREETMCRVADYILNFQKEALAKGRNEIKTLTIDDVAKALNLHPSTVCRTISNKYIQVADKTISLKTLLSGGMQKRNGEIISKAAIKNKMETVIKNEDKARPFSDEDIKRELEKEDIKIERRTVAKYRTCLRILPAHLRRKATRN